MIFFISRDVVFYDDIFPYLASLPDSACLQWEAYFSQNIMLDDNNDTTLSNVMMFVARLFNIFLRC